MNFLKNSHSLKINTCMLMKVMNFIINCSLA